MLLSLTKEQQEVYDAILNGESVFLTGKAGTGKTYVIEKVLERMENVAVLAPTGTAALNAGGVTIHKFLHLKAEPPIRSDFKIRIKTPDILLNTDTIIIDEISMCRLDLFDCLISSIKKSDRDNHRHTQIVAVGDFCQLPPVINDNSGEKELLNSYYGRNINGGFAFQGDMWKECDFTPFVLTQVLRQENEEFIHNLNKARLGDITCIPFFSANSSPAYVQDGIYLAGRNNEVSRINKENLANVSGQIHTFTATKSGDDISKSVIAEEILELKIGAKVMVLCNDTENKYSNGSIGTVIGINDQTISVNINGNIVQISRNEWESFTYEVINKKLYKRKTGSFVQFPLKLAYAVTIHKSQGQTFEKVNLNPDCWDSGQLYCALSRIKDVSNLYLTKAIQPSFLKLDKEVKEFYDNLKNKKETIPKIDIKKEEMTQLKIPQLMPSVPNLIMEDGTFCLFKIPIEKKEAIIEFLKGEKNEVKR